VNIEGLIFLQLRMVMELMVNWLVSTLKICLQRKLN